MASSVEKNIFTATEIWKILKIEVTIIQKEF